MSFRSVQQNSLENSDTLSVPPFAAARGAGSGWVRNPSWPALPSIVASDNKFVGLYAVYPNSAFAAVICATSTGTYTVDWGDGTSPQTYTSGTQANYTYAYNAAGLANTNAPVTFTDATDTVNRNNHGYQNGMQISFDSITTTTGITAGQPYYVVNATTNTFQLSATSFGSVLPLTNDGSGIILPYKIAAVTITPTTGGANLTTVNLQARNSSTTVAYNSGWLDLAVAGAITTLTIGATATTTTVHSLLEQARILRHRATSHSALFANCYSLQNVVEITADTGINVTDCSNMFLACYSLVAAPFFNTATVTNMQSMFDTCGSLTSVPLYNTAAVTTMNSMFNSCRSLPAVPLFNTASVNNMQSTFANCVSLVSVPLFNTASLTGTAASISQGGFSFTFQNCSQLKSTPSFNTPNLIATGGMFQSCVSLQSIGLFDTSKVTIAANMFNSCVALKNIPPFNFSAISGSTGTIATDGATSMFQNCVSLESVPAFNFAALVDGASMFSGCTSLKYIPKMNMPNIRDTGGMFTNCTALQEVPDFDFSLANSQGIGAGFLSFSGLSSLSRIRATNFQNSLNVSNCKLSGAALDEIYTNLPTIQPAATAVTFQASPTNTVTLNNHGYANLRTVRFATVVTTTGISANTDYYVRNATTNTFQLSTSPTGAILTLTNNGTGTMAGATITVTGNWGTATDTPTIATNKGWTVTGS